MRISSWWLPHGTASVGHFPMGVSRDGSIHFRILWDFFQGLFDLFRCERSRRSEKLIRADLKKSSPKRHSIRMVYYGVPLVYINGLPLCTMIYQWFTMVTQWFSMVCQFMVYHCYTMVLYAMVHMASHVTPGYRPRYATVCHGPAVCHSAP